MYNVNPRDIRGIAYSYFFGYLYDNMNGHYNNIIIDYRNDIKEVKTPRGNMRKISSISNHQNDVLIYRKITLEGIYDSTWYMVTEVKHAEISYETIAKNLITHLIGFRHNRSNAQCGKKHFPKFNTVVKKCSELVLPQISDSDDFKVEKSILDFDPITSKKADYTLVYKYIRVGRIINMLYDQINFIFDQEYEKWRDENSALLAIMSKPSVEIIANNTIDNNTGIPNIIRVRIPLLKRVTINDIKNVPSTSLNSYIWYHINNHSKALHEAALMRKFFKIDRMILTNTGELEIMYSLKGDTNCTI